jgi:hypothetical protein
MNLRKRTLLILGVVSILLFSVSVVTTLTIGIGG